MTREVAQHERPTATAAVARVLDAALRADVEALFPRYPTRQAVTLPALHAVNERLGYVPPQAVVEIAELLGLAPAQVQDTLSFYGYFRQDKPLGATRIMVCRSISCAARGGEGLLEYLCDALDIKPGETTSDGRATVTFAECLGACEGAPVMLANDTLHACLDREKIKAFVESLKRDAASREPVPPEPCIEKNAETQDLNPEP